MADDQRRVLVLNSGSSSIKFELVGPDGARVSGLVERIGEPGGVADHAEGMAQVLSSLDLDGVAVVGHRVVHGGEEFQQPTVVDEAVLARIRELSALAPLHNPANLLGIEAARAALPGVPHVAVFDTAFHVTLPAHAYRYALPDELYRRHGVRRYGFHGTSHGYVARQAAAVLGRPLESLRMVTLHLGNGASATAVDGGHSVDTSMGFGPLEGLVMGTRSGDVDTTIVLHLVRGLGLSLDEVEDLLNRHSGLRGLCGDNDMRAVVARAAAGDEAARLALDVTTYRLRKYVGAYAAALGGLDAVVFTAGIGEHSPVVRAMALEGLGFLGIELDPARNEANASVISTDASAVAVLVIPTDEEREIARQALAALS